MRFFQKKLVASYGAIAFSIVFIIIAFAVSDFIGEKVYWNYFDSSEVLRVMFLAPPPPEEYPPLESYRWPYPIVYGLFANDRPGEPWESIAIYTAAIIGGFAVAFFWGLVLSAAHIVLRRILYGRMIPIREAIIQYLKKTIFWNTIFAASLGTIYGFRITSSMSALDITVSAFLMFVVLVAVIFFRQHALNKWVSEKEIGSA